MEICQIPTSLLLKPMAHHGPPSAPSSASAENPARRRSMRLKPPEAVDVLPYKNHGIHDLYKQFSVLLIFIYLFIYLNYTKLIYYIYLFILNDIS
jgi:hypothetical protein